MIGCIFGILMLGAVGWAFNVSPFLGVPAALVALMTTVAVTTTKN